MAEVTIDRAWTRLDWKLVLLLILLTGTLRGWQLTHTEVAARDSIGFIRHAWRYHQTDLADWPEVLQHSEQHPIYPLVVLGVSQLLAPLYQGPTAYLMQYSAQVASTLAAILLVLPLYALGRLLFDRRVGFFSALLLQCLPVSGRILSDGLSEATFLLFAVSALYFGALGLRRHSPGAFALTGFFGGLAYLTRPEGILVVAATGVVLLAGQAVGPWRRAWRLVIRCGASLAATALLLGVPFVVITGKLSVKPAANKILAQPDADSAIPRTEAGVLLAVWDFPDAKHPTERFWWGFYALGTQLVKGFFYLGWPLVILGMWRHRDLFRRMEVWLLVLLCVAMSCTLWRVAVYAGYLSDRHALLVLVCAIPWAIAGATSLGSRLAARWPRLGPATVLLPLAFSIAGLPKLLEPLHYYRAGFREVGLWLADHTHPVDRINDPLCWAHYYAGRVFLEHTEQAIPSGYRAHEYIVLEEAGNSHPRVPVYQEAAAKTKDLEPLHVWEGKRGRKRVKVLVYAVPLGT